MKKHRKILLIVSIIILSVILLFPAKNMIRDGGSIEYKALLYSVLFHHPNDVDTPHGYIDGFKVEILGFEVYRNYEEIT